MNKTLWTCLALAGLAGCTSRTTSSTPRTAVEQLLLTRAVDLALLDLRLPEIAGKKVYTDFSNLKSYDAEYVKVACRARFAELGATLVEKPDQADCVVEVASGCLGMEYKSKVVGVPALPVPNAPVPTPDLPLFRSVEQTAIMKLLIFVHAKGKFVVAARYYAKADRDENFLLWYRYQSQDQVREGWQRAEAESLRRRKGDRDTRKAGAAPSGPPEAVR